MAGSQGTCIVNFVRNCQTNSFKWLHHFLPPPAVRAIHILTNRRHGWAFQFQHSQWMCNGTALRIWKYLFNFYFTYSKTGFILVSSSVSFNMLQIRIATTTIRTQNSSITQKSSLLICPFVVTISSYPSPLVTTSVVCPYSSAFSGMPYKQKHAVCLLFKLSSFNLHNAFKIPYWYQYPCGFQLLLISKLQ